MIDFIKNNIFSFISIFISILSLCITLFNLYINRKKLDVVIEDELDKIDNIYTNYFEYKNQDPSLNFGCGKVCFIKVVNPSPKDIAFFDLRVVDLDNMKPLFFISSAVLELTNLTKEKIFYGSNDVMAKVNIPHSNYGVFKSNSFTRIDVPFYPSETTTKVLVSFKVAISSIQPNTEAGYRKKFKYYKKVFNITL
ncbi:MAG: hypothetical protein KH200_11910 [Clostridium sp.]|uniref:hypothetical protein n=1 Tax=Clostridium TaxID=1485 RepID=UPI00257CC247|nr:hypothetical protein [Clostridium sp.]MBS6888597.1 hypothetical protein [Clostridium sp.]